MVLGGVLLLSGGNGGGVSPGPSGDVFQQCADAQRVAEVAILRELQAKEFSNDKAKQDWINAERIAKREAAFEPYTDALGEAVFSGKVSEFADKLEAKR